MKNNKADRAKANQTKSTIVEDFMATISPVTRRSVRKKMEIAVQIEEVMLAKGWTQKEFAAQLGKRESEVSKWLSGKQNFTLESLCLIEETLGCEIFQVPMYAQSVPQKALDHLAAMQRQSYLWKMPMAKGNFVPRPAGAYAISIDHFSVQPLKNL